MTDEKLTTGLNDRPKNDSIGQTAGGLPDDSGQPIEVDDQTVRAIEKKLTGDRGDHSNTPGNAAGSK